jgi:uncharacterized repeat protein (TIGR01451 family)
MSSLVKKLSIVILILISTVFPVQAVIGPVGGEVLVNTNNLNTAQSLAEIAMDANGNFVVAWIDTDTPVGGLLVRLYDALGNPRTAPIFVTNTDPTHVVGLTGVAMDANGNFVVAYSVGTIVPNDSDIFMRLYDMNGVPQTAEILVNSTTANLQFYPEVAMAGNGSIVVVVWHSEFTAPVFGTEMRARLFDPTGAALGGDFQVDTPPTSQLFSDVAMDAAGNFVVVWDEDGPDGDLGGIMARRYNSAGVPQGAEFIVNSVTANNQYRPSVKMNATGDFIVVWTSDGQDPDGSEGVYARRFNSLGVPQGVEFNPATNYIGGQTSVDVALDNGGNFLVIWANTTAGPSQGAYVRRFDAAGLPLENELLVSPLLSGDPSVGMFSPTQFVVAYSTLNHPSGNYVDVFFQRFADVPSTPPTTAPPNASVPNPSISLFDPAISKIGFLTPGQLGVTGEALEWVITVTNNGTSAGTNVVISDTLRAELRVDRVQTSKGSSNVNGQTVTVAIPSLAPSESVQIHIFTTVLSGVSVDNTACVRADNLSGERCATGRAVRSLPTTSEPAWWRIGLSITIFIGIWALGLLVRRKAMAVLSR